MVDNTTVETVDDVKRQISDRKTGMAYAAVESSNTVQQGVAAGVIGAQAALYSTVLSAIWQMFLLPAAAIFGVLSAIISWRLAALNKNEGYPFFRAVVDTIFAAALIAASVGAIVATVAFSIAGPAIYAATIAARALFDFGSAIFFAVKAKREKVPKNAEDKDPEHQGDPFKKADYKAKATTALVQGLVGAVITGAIAAITFVASPIAYVGALVAWTIAATFGVFWAVKEYQRLQVDSERLSNRPVTQTSTATLNNVFSLRKSNNQAPEAKATETAGKSAKKTEAAKSAAEVRGTSTLSKTETETETEEDVLPQSPSARKR